MLAMSHVKTRHILLQSFGAPYSDLEPYSQKHYMARSIKLLLENDRFDYQLVDWHETWYDDAKVFAELGDLFVSLPPTS